MDTGATELRRRHQMVLLEMLKEFDRICRRHDIPYMLFAGTALGAQRHGGFIPWDDDLDVIMLRPAYQRFLEVAESELDGAYYLQKEFSDHWPMFFSKLRKNGTACMEKFRPKDQLMHQGVYMDIFPCDALSDSRIMRGLQFAASKLVIAHALDRRGYLTDSPVKKAVMALSRHLPAERLHRFVVQCGGERSRRVHSFFGASSRYGRSVYLREWLEETMLRPFEDGQFPVSAHNEALLRQLYGDWPRIPTPEERACKEHSAIVDLDRPYTDYLARQQNMKIQTYSRSIR